MLQSKKGFALMLLVCVFACSLAAAQDRAPKKLDSIPVKDATLEKPETTQEPSSTEKIAAGRNLSCGSSDKPDVLEKQEIPLAAVKDRPANPAAPRAVIVPLEVDPFLQTDSGQMRKSWSLSVGFGRRVNPESTPVPHASNSDDPASPAGSQKFHWKPAIQQSLVAQGFQIGYALVFQEKTRRALKGPFFRDYWKSIKEVRGWSDNNKFFTNYIAHPMQGAFTGFIYAQNHDRVKKQIFNESNQYWKDRAMAMLWSAAWSTNWEIGPISQSSIGNVGLYGRQGWVDFVITPTAGTVWMVAEEALDRYIIRHHDSKSLFKRIVLRSFLNPTRSVANVFRFKVPWHRDRD